MKNYYLMNKDRVVAEFYSQKGRFSRKDTLFEIGCIYDKMPFGAEEDLTAWISDRKAAKHRVHLKEIMEELGCYDNEGFINITHIAGINDTFWAKPADSNLTWQDVSLYRNEFTEAVSALVFEGMKRHHQQFSSTSPDHSPELVVDGSYPKCFRKEKQTGEYGSDIFIYKRGHKDTSFEPYCEQMASEIAKIISPENSVSYEMTMLHGRRSSKCNLFTNENIGYAPYCDFAGKGGASLDRIFEFGVYRNTSDLKSVLSENSRDFREKCNCRKIFYQQDIAQTSSPDEILNLMAQELQTNENILIHSKDLQDTLNCRQKRTET